MMDPSALLSPESPIGYPTPFWFMEGLKVLGFALHVSAMNLWYVGAPLAAFLGVFGHRHMRTVGWHIAMALPFALAFGINFGIVPLLFVQVMYHQFFYPATILMAWAWFSVFWLVIVAYTSVYLYRLAINGNFNKKLGFGLSFVAGGMLVVVGFVFANAMSLMTNVDGWWTIFNRANAAGAATGLAHNLSDPTLIPRWLFMIGLAITTTAAYVVIDAAFLSSRESPEYRQYAGKFALALYSIGVLWYAAVGSWYIFGTRMDYWMQAMGNPWMKIIFPLTAIAPGLPWLLILMQWKGITRRLAVFTGITQFGVIGINAISRQWLQNMELAPYADLTGRKVDLQLSAWIVFLVLFVAGVALSAWIIRKAIQANRATGVRTTGAR